MPVTPSHLLATFHTSRQALWESLSLLAPAEWTTPVLGGVSPQEMLAARLDGDLALAAALSVPPAAFSYGLSYGALMEQAVAAAQTVAEKLQDLDDDGWQAGAPGERQAEKGVGDHQTLAGWVEALNDGYLASRAELDAYLGSFERLGKEGLNRWLLAVYNEIMDSVAGMTDAEIMGEPWHGEWNTYQVLEHVWAWNEQILDIARHWGQNPAPRPLRPLPLVGERNRHLGKVYDGADMVAVADAIVTVYRKTAQLVNRSEPALLCQVDDYPWPGRGPLCNLIFEGYRHAYQHALEIRGRQVDR